ncbi:Uncharacterized protein dnm_044760 [Desulfonema magnum]|uniref:Uncharacterized protein n=1 Tax=Desulfonema magnum TaxID=45655 RepID=A0A975BN01_9BACT|nr:Uncharacterized protein dnm_044760 [Desulfonema magnum]
MNTYKRRNEAHYYFFTGPPETVRQRHRKKVLKVSVYEISESRKKPKDLFCLNSKAGNRAPRISGDKIVRN